jgi:hypothetical protein
MPVFDLFRRLLFELDWIHWDILVAIDLAIRDHGKHARTAR